MLNNSFIVIAVVSIFVMLLFKPILNHLILYVKKQSRGNHVVLNEEEDFEDGEVWNKNIITKKHNCIVNFEG